MVKKLLLVLISAVVLTAGWFAFQQYGIKYLKLSRPVITSGGSQSWWKYGGNAENSFFGVGKGPKGKIAWTYNTLSTIYEGIAIGADGTLYFQCMNGKAYAVDSKTGKLIWESNINTKPFWKKLPEDIEVSKSPKKLSISWTAQDPVSIFTPPGEGIITPAVGPNATVYFPSIDGKLYALDARTGKRKWVFFEKMAIAGQKQFETGMPKINQAITIYRNMSSPNVTRDNKVVFCMNNNVIAVDGRTGRKLWEHKDNWGMTGPLVFGEG